MCTSGKGRAFLTKIVGFCHSHLHSMTLGLFICHFPSLFYYLAPAGDTCLSCHGLEMTLSLDYGILQLKRSTGLDFLQAETCNGLESRFQAHHFLLIAVLDISLECKSKNLQLCRFKEEGRWNLHIPREKTQLWTLRKKQPAQEQRFGSAVAGSASRDTECGQTL